MTEGINQAQVDRDFAAMMDGSVEEEAQQLLDRQLARLTQWIDQHDPDTDPVSLRKLINQALNEPNKRHHVIVAYCAALWRLKDGDGRDHE